MITDQLRTPTGVGPNQKAIFDLDLGYNYRTLWIAASVAAGNKRWDEIIEDIFLEVNGKPQRSHTPQELNDLNTLHDENLGITMVGDLATNNLVSHIPIFLAETFRKNVDHGLSLGWNAVGIRSFQLKVKLKAGIVDPQIAGWGVWTPGNMNMGLGPITKWKRQDLDAVGTPKDFGKVFDVGGDKDNFLQSLHLWPTNSGVKRYVTEAELKFNDLTVHHRTNTVNQAILLSNGMEPDLGASPRYDLILDESDSVVDVQNLKFVNKQNLNLTFDGAPNGGMRAISLETGPVE